MKITPLAAHEEFIRDNAMELRKKIGVGLEQIRRGEILDGDQVFNDLIQKNRQRPRTGK